MSYKKVVNSCNNEVLYTDVDSKSGFIVGKYENNRAFIIIDGDWYVIEKDRMFRNSFCHKALDYIFNNTTERYPQDVRQYDNFFEASQYINEIIGERND